MVKRLKNKKNTTILIYQKDNRLKLIIDLKFFFYQLRSVGCIIHEMVFMNRFYKGLKPTQLPNNLQQIQNTLIKELCVKYDWFILF